MIISIGFRVNSKTATKFRIWATKILKEYMVKGFAIDVDKMKNGPDSKMINKVLNHNSKLNLIE